MKPIIYILITFLLQSCVSAKNKIGTEYRSVCNLYHVFPTLILSLNADGTFLYKMALFDKKITGTWRIHKRYLIMESPYFTNAYDDKWADSMRVEFWKNADGDTVLTNIYTKAYISKLMPAHKYTENAESDIFLIKGEKLFAIDSTGIRKHCALVKMK